MQRVEAANAVSAIKQPLLHRNTAGTAELRQQIMQRVFPIILFTRHHGITAGGGVRDDGPFHAVNLRRAPAGQAIHFFLARHIALILRPDSALARVPFIADEAERPAAHGFADLLEGIGAGDAFGHDEAGKLRLPQSHDQQGRWLMEAEAKALIIQGFQHGDIGPKHLGEGVSLGPAIDGGDAILGQHPFAIMEHQPITQREGQRQPILRSLPALGHLRLDLALRVFGAKLVIDHEGVVARDDRRGPNRIKAGEVRLRNNAERPRRGTLGIGWRAKPARRKASRGTNKASAIHLNLPFQLRRMPQ